MRRRPVLFLALAALSLCAAAVAAGAISLWRDQSLLLVHMDSGNLWVGWVRGRAWVQLAEPVAIDKIGTSAQRFESRPASGEDGLGRDHGFSAFGFEFVRGPLQEIGGTVVVRETLVVVPLWAVAVLSAIAGWLLIRRARSSQARGFAVEPPTPET